MSNYYWKTNYESGWDRFKAAMAADWEQTKHDFGSDTARDLDQDVDDTVKQMAGKQPIPEIEREEAYRYGYSAALSHENRAWDDTIDTELRTNYAGDYDRDAPYIRRAYDRQVSTVLR
jgi:hypothetical protein